MALAAVAMVEVVNHGARIIQAFFGNDGEGGVRDAAQVQHQLAQIDGKKAVIDSFVLFRPKSLGPCMLSWKIWPF